MIYPVCGDLLREKPLKLTGRLLFGLLLEVGVEGGADQEDYFN